MNMNRRHRIALAGVLALVVTVVTGAALATHGGLHGLFNSRGTIEPFTIRNADMRLKIKAKEPIDVAIVGAQLDPGSQTGWHIHPADSIVTVRPGGPALRMIYSDRGQCQVRTFQPGQAFVHPAGPHNFVNPDAASPLAFGVAYFVPVGAPLLTNVSPPGACS
jgi:quercetin dioxygenase-like cupin family protein